MPVIDQTLITKYCRLQRSINKAEARQKERREKILSQLRAGSTLPEDGPFVIALAQNGPHPHWQEIFHDYLVRLFARKLGIKAAQKRAVKRILELREEYRRDNPGEVIQGAVYEGGVKFNTRVNDAYRRARPVRDVA